MYQTIRRQAADALYKFLHCPFKPLDEKLFKEYLCRTLLDISRCKKGAEELQYYAKVIRTILYRNATCQKDVCLIRRLIKFCLNHPIEVAAMIPTTMELKNMLGLPLI